MQIRRGFTHELIGLLAIAMLVGCGTGTTGEGDAVGNGADALKSLPSGPHYDLNIIGVSNPKSSSMDCGVGHRIFVPLTGSSKILLSEGDFQVLDCNGTDGSASFQLPNPDPTNSGTTTYSVYARALGKPGGGAKMTTCATDPTTGELYCSVDSATLIRLKGSSAWQNVSQDLLYIYADLNGDGKLERYPLFDGTLQDYFWQYDNTGLRLAQLRFYQVSTTVR